MTKLYISYYGDYVSIVEGKYDKKKNKYILDDIIFVSREEENIPFDYNDKYDLLRVALSKNEFKSKSVVLCINTRDVVVKSSILPMLSPKDLNGLMDLEIEDMISLDSDKYTFSYEVSREIKNDEESKINVILAGILKEEIYEIDNIFKQNKLEIEAIDTIATSYLRVLKHVAYDDIMIMNIGEYGSIVDIYKDDFLFIHDNIPIKFNKESSYQQCLALGDETSGLINYYSSRNFGKVIDTILILGKHTYNNDIYEVLKSSFASEIVQGIDNLFDIKEDLNRDIPSEDLNKIVGNLGCMLRDSEKEKYSFINLITKEMRLKQQKKKNVKSITKVIPIAIVLLFIPFIAISFICKNQSQKLEDTKSEIKDIKTQYEQVSDIDENIKKLESEMKIYDMLLSKQFTWGSVLNSIDNNIPYKVDLTSLSVEYNPKGEENEETSSRDKEELQARESQKIDDKNQIQDKTDELLGTKEESKVAIYDQIPNVLNLKGEAKQVELIGQFVYKLSKFKYFDSVDLQSVYKLDKDGKIVYSFDIKIQMKEGALN